MAIYRTPPPGADNELENPKSSVAETTTLLPGNTAILDSAQITAGMTGYLVGIYVSGNSPWSFDLHTVTNGVNSVKRLRGHGFDSKYVPMAHKRFISVAHHAVAGFDGFRVVLVNEDTGSQAGDFAVSLFWDEEA